MEKVQNSELYRQDRDFAVKAAIFESLRNLICGENGKPLDKVTVDEICEGCGISRRTFYNHFPDKYAVVVWIREVGGAGNFAQIGLSLTLRDAVRGLIQATSEYRDFLRECYKSKHYGRVESYIRKLARAGLKYAVALRSGKPLSDAGYIKVRYLVVAIDTATREWVEGKKFNPHSWHHTQNQCTDCHKSHRASVLVCTQCHNESDPDKPDATNSIPEGWLDYDTAVKLQRASF